MKLTGLNIDCLESVFEYLKLGDLLNVASSNKRLKKATNFIIDRHRWHKIVSFEKIHVSQNRSFEVDDYWIVIHDLKTSLQYIRCFGHLVSDILFKLSGQIQSEVDQHVMNYINEYCSDSLKSIKIYNGLKGWEHLKKQFFKVEDVTLDGCAVTDKDCLNRLFPKMLKLWFCDYDNEKHKNHFPNLKELAILDYKCTGDAIAPILRLNPQLKDIYINTKQPILDSIDFQNAIGNLQELQTLSLYVKRMSTESIESEICLNSIKTLYIEIDSIYNVTKIPFLCGQLDTLNMTCSNALNTELSSFFDKHSTIQSLNLNVASFSLLDESKLTKSLPLLKTLSLWRCKMSADEAIHFMSKFQYLQNFYFDINDINTYDVFQARLSNEWKCEIDLWDRISVNRITNEVESNRIIKKAT